MSKNLPTEPYKGVRDFYPDDMAIQRYMFSVWEQTAESFGFERYDASVLEPSELYKAKGAENEEMVNEQTYTFIDRGDREVTLRPEMTPTVARMIAAKRKELAFPVRWYSIPNLFRYERTQRGRLREHWQLNCDIFGSNDIAADVEIIALAYQIFLNFGADEESFSIRVNSRSAMNAWLKESGITKEEDVRAITNVVDRKSKMDADAFTKELKEAARKNLILPEVAPNEVQAVLDALHELGINNVIYDSSVVRGFNYYTGTVFEIFDNDPENNRAMMGGGRYDNLTELFGGDPIPGVGFGFGDVTLRNFLESHNLLTASITAPTLMIIPTDASLNISGEKVAQTFRAAGISVATDLSDRKIGKKIAAASDALVDYILVLGEEEIVLQKYTVKKLAEGTETSGTIEQLLDSILA